MIINGWGRYPKIDANLFYPENKSQCFNYIKKNPLYQEGQEEVMEIVLIQIMYYNL